MYEQVHDDVDHYVMSRGQHVEERKLSDDVCSRDMVYGVGYTSSTIHYTILYYTILPSIHPTCEVTYMV